MMVVGEVEGEGMNEEPGPAVLRPEDVVHAEDLGDEDRQGDDQLVDSSQLEIKS